MMHQLAETPDAIFQDVWSQLARATRDRRSELRWMNLATTTPDGTPRLRTVVLREVIPATRQIAFHTDRRSSKSSELEVNPRVALHFHDRRGALQIRMEGLAHASQDFDRVNAWRKLHPGSREQYAQELAPGSEISSPTDAIVRSEATDRGGFENFTVVAVQIDLIDWLSLAQSGHRRAAFRMSDGIPHCLWLAP
ncbi:MAG: pyridoxamine 5'-phosphate oxidase [Hyphomicrobiaceae bacterium TMED74]|nr:pyridoxamine 5'-phosphate oxidase [Filomicrobium sp.]RPG38465.1 MAG: pyridoxamine 5'-phosphate oxidase [Hyphomicrobiaceae bacterium TMED74]